MESMGDLARTHKCNDLTDADTGQEVILMGWVLRRRDHGGVIFVDLRDREGLVQVVFDPDKPEMFALAERIRNEYVLKVKGRVRLRDHNNRQLQLTISLLGRIRICVPGNGSTFSGYPAC